MEKQMSETLSIKKDKPVEELIELKIVLGDCQQPAILHGGKTYFHNMYYKVTQGEADSLNECMRRGIGQSAQEEGKNSNVLRKKQQLRVG